MHGASFKKNTWGFVFSWQAWILALWPAHGERPFEHYFVIHTEQWENPNSNSEQYTTSYAEITIAH